MPRAVRFDHYGGVDVLDVVEVDAPSAGEGEVVVRVEAAGINPGEAAIRQGVLHDRWPATFPSGQGSDLAGVVTEVGPGSRASRSATRSSATPTTAPATPSSPSSRPSI
jgi:NADPH:quinone reductase-like Zn-dependent oxidoreductase